MSKINKAWSLEYLEPSDYLKRFPDSKGHTDPNSKTIFIKKAKFPWANQHTVGHEINHVVQREYTPTNWNNIVLNNQSFDRVIKRNEFPTIRYNDYTTVDPNYADTFPSLNKIRLLSENTPDPKNTLWYSSPSEIDSEFAGNLFEGYNPKETVQNIHQRWKLGGFSIEPDEIENVNKLFRTIDVNNKQKILLNGRRSNPKLNATRSYLYTVNESDETLEDFLNNISSGIRITTGGTAEIGLGLNKMINDNE